MDREIEVKLEITKENYQKFLSLLLENGVNHTKKEQNDIYFSPKYRPFFGGDIDDECLRIRVMNDRYILSYKKIFFGNSYDDIHLEEHESDVSNLEQTIKILECLDIEKVLTLHKIRDSFMYEGIFEISLDNVFDLGYFMEIEVKDNTLSVSVANQKLKELISSLGLSLSSRNLDGYANMLYEKLHGKKN